MRLFLPARLICLVAFAAAVLSWAAEVPAASLMARGDANNDGAITLADAVHVSQYLFAKGPAPLPTSESGDANCDARVDPLDAIAIVNYVMRAGPRPGCPAE